MQSRGGAHLTLPTAERWVPSLSPQKGGEGKSVQRGHLLSPCRLAMPAIGRWHFEHCLRWRSVHPSNGLARG